HIAADFLSTQEADFEFGIIHGRTVGTAGSGNDKARLPKKGKRLLHKAATGQADGQFRIVHGMGRMTIRTQEVNPRIVQKRTKKRFITLAISTAAPDATPPRRRQKRCARFSAKARFWRKPMPGHPLQA